MPGDNVTILLEYEELLERRDGRYEYSVSVSPGEIVPDLRVDLSFEDSLPLTDLKVSAPVVGDLLRRRVVARAGLKKDRVSFSMGELEQHDYFGRHGFTGDVEASFDVGGDGDGDGDGDVDLVRRQTLLSVDSEINLYLRNHSRTKY